MEDYYQGSTTVPFANYGTVTFSNAVALTAQGATVGPQNGAKAIDTIANGKIISAASIGDDSVTVTYHGN